jgi:unsaturated rhamnogalacturonyl hydrolase
MMIPDGFEADAARRLGSLAKTAPLALGTRGMLGTAAIALAGLVVCASASAAEAADPARAIRVRVTNSLDTPRGGETVELTAAALEGRVAPQDLPRLRVTDLGTGRELLSQAVDEDGDDRLDLLVFQIDLAPGETRELALALGERRKPRREDFRVYGRFVRERQDDFAWENDRVAFRVYGPALETFAKEPLTSSAVDAWSKRTSRLVLNDWYLTDDYHQDHGEGGDFYPAGTTRGCGGSGLVGATGLAVSRNFRASRVLASGPIRLVFELDYPVWDTLPNVREKKRVTLDAGSHFNRFESLYTGVDAAGASEGDAATITWAAGVRKAQDVQTAIDRERGFVRTWELQDRYGDNGWLGCAVVMDPAQVVEAREADGNLLLLARTKAGSPARWYAGSGWDRGGEFRDAEAWDRHVRDFVRRLASPLRVEVVAP